MGWLESIPWSDKILSDLVLYVSSVFAFALMPAQLGRKLWALIAWFLAVNAFFLLGLEYFPNWQNPWIFAALGQAPWLLFVLDLLFKGRLSGVTAELPMRGLVLWNVTRLMGLHFVLAIYGGFAPQDFALQVGFSEMITGLGALGLYVLYRPERGWYRTLLVFWNTYGLTSVVAADYRMLLSNPHPPFGHYSREIFQYAISYPQSWVYCFWFPIAIGMHAAIFHKMYLGRAS